MLGHLHCLGFSLFPLLYISFKNIFVAALHQVRVSFSLLPLLLLILIVLVLLFSPGLECSGKGQLSERAGHL